MTQRLFVPSFLTSFPPIFIYSSFNLSTLFSFRPSFYETTSKLQTSIRENLITLLNTLVSVSIKFSLQSRSLRTYKVYFPKTRETLPLRILLLKRQNQRFLVGSQNPSDRILRVGYNRVPLPRIPYYKRPSQHKDPPLILQWSTSTHFPETEIGTLLLRVVPPSGPCRHQFNFIPRDTGGPFIQLLKDLTDFVMFGVLTTKKKKTLRGTLNSKCFRKRQKQKE